MILKELFILPNDQIAKLWYRNKNGLIYLTIETGYRQEFILYDKKDFPVIDYVDALRADLDGFLKEGVMFRKTNEVVRFGVWLN